MKKIQDFGVLDILTNVNTFSVIAKDIFLNVFIEQPNNVFSETYKWW